MADGGSPSGQGQAAPAKQGGQAGEQKTPHPWHQVAVYRSNRGGEYLQGEVYRHPEGQYQVVLSRVKVTERGEEKQETLRLHGEKEVKSAERMLSAMQQEIALHKQKLEREDGPPLAL